MQRSCWPARAARLHRHQQRLRPAAVHERAGGWLTEELIEVEQARLVLRLEQDPVPVPGPQLVAERHRGEGPATVGQGPGSARRLGRRDHRQDGRDADAARNEQVAPGELKGEVVARSPGTHAAAFCEHIMHVAGPAPARGLAQHGDTPGRGVGRITAQ
jgi:hypothetical protein